MFVSFFEEFPTRRNLDKIKLVNWPTKIYVGAKSLNEFNKIITKVKNKYIKEFIWWPILEIKEGYWISPFSNRGALKRIFQELKDKNVPVMLDLELPTTKNLKLYITEFANFFRNKLLIKEFIKKYNGEIYLAEYYPQGKKKERLLQFLGLHYRSNNVKIIKMIYNSIHSFNKGYIESELGNCKKEFKERFIAAYGLLANGISGNEPKISLLQLEEDIKIAKSAGINEIIVYRLGGLNNGYINVLNKHDNSGFY